MSHHKKKMRVKVRDSKDHTKKRIKIENDCIKIQIRVKDDECEIE